MAEENQAAPSPRRGDEHAGAAANPEAHLSDIHKLSIQVQGKEGSRGHAVWSLTRGDGTKTKTLTVFEGTRLEAAHHFFKFMHPNAPAPGPTQFRRPSGPSQSRSGRSGGRPPGRPAGRPAGR